MTPEWNTEALGKNKRRLAAELFCKSAGALRAVGARAFRSGQMVSGRATAALVAELLLAQGRRADLDRAPRSSPTRRVDYPEARRQRAAASRTRWRRDWAWARSTCSPAYEDVFYYLWRERTLPANVDPLNSQARDPLERAR